MTQEQLKTLKPGDLVRHKLSPVVYVVTSNYGDRVTAVGRADLTNPSEWKKVNAEETK